MEELDFEASKKALGERISKLRKKKGMSLEKLAYEAGVSKGNLSDIENGKRDPRYTTLLLLATGLEVSISTFFKNV